MQSKTDKREYHLAVTDRYYKYWNINEKYLDLVEKRLESVLTEDEFSAFNRDSVQDFQGTYAGNQCGRG